MRVRRIVYPVETLGPGQRVVVWTQGCSKHCFGCANPDLWDPEDARGSNMSVGGLVRFLQELRETRGVHRVTFTGGDPLEQADELVEVLEQIDGRYDDILLYTGYTLAEAREACSKAMERIEGIADVLIDGRYCDELNDGRAVLRGSTNQVIHLLDPTVEPEYRAYAAQGRQVANFIYEGQVLSVGIHNRGAAPQRIEEVHGE